MIESLELGQVHANLHTVQGPMLGIIEATKLSPLKTLSVYHFTLAMAVVGSNEGHSRLGKTRPRALCRVKEPTRFNKRSLLRKAENIQIYILHGEKYPKVKVQLRSCKRNLSRVG
jgi:hypothetical protein